MRITQLATAIALALCFSAFPALAEVRVVRSPHGGLDLGITVTDGRIWTPHGQQDASVLNPDGDLRGDGYPAHASTGDRLVAAWVRPSTATLEVASLTVTDDLTERWGHLAARGAYGTPVVIPLDDAWALVWMERDGGTNRILLAAMATDARLSDPVIVGDGLLGGVVATGASVHVLGIASNGAVLNVATSVVAYVPEVPVPIPIFTRLVTVQLFPPSAGIYTPDIPSPIPIFTRDGDRAVASWKAGPGLVGTIELDEDGVVGDVTFSRGVKGAGGGQGQR